MGTINELNTTDTLAGDDKLVIWKDQAGATRAITAEDAAAYFNGTPGGPFQPLDELLTAIAGLGPSTAAGDFIELTAQDTVRVRKLSVATYAALTVIPASFRFDDMLVYVASRATDGDGGEGWWRFDAASSATANGGTILAPDAGTGRWLRQYSGAVNVKWFGAKGDGTTDNVSAIQAAINAGLTNAVYIPTGVYNISAEISISLPISIKGDGVALSIIRTTNATANILKINAAGNILTGFTFEDFQLAATSAKTDGAAIFASSTSAGAIYDLKIYRVQTDANQAHGFYAKCNGFYWDFVDFVIGGISANKVGFFFQAYGVSEYIAAVWMTNCKVKSGVSSTATTGILLDSYSQGFYLQSCSFESTLDRGIWVRNTLSAARPVENLFFNQCVCDFSRINGLEIDDVFTAVFANCWFTSCLGHGANVNGQDIAFVNGTFIGNGEAGLRVLGTATQVRASNSLFDANNQGGAGWSGINLNADTSNVIITGNHFRRSGSTPSQAYAIQITNGASSNLLITQNDFSGAVTAGFAAATLTGSGNIISDNIGAWSGSATYDPPSLNDGDGVTTTVTVTGAVLGMFVEASFSQALVGVLLNAWVSAADTVSVRFQNESGGTVDLASGTLRARVALKT